MTWPRVKGQTAFIKSIRDLIRFLTEHKATDNIPELLWKERAAEYNRLLDLSGMDKTPKQRKFK